MFGERKLELPSGINIVEEAESILKEFGFEIRSCYGIVSTARRLIELNNEVYDKVQDLEDRINKIDGEE